MNFVMPPLKVCRDIVDSKHKRFASTQFSSLDQAMKEMALDPSIYDYRHSDTEGNVKLVDYSSTSGSSVEDVVCF